MKSSANPSTSELAPSCNYTIRRSADLAADIKRASGEFPERKRDKTITGTSFGLFCLAAIAALYFLSATAQERKGNEKKQDDKPGSIAGAWDAEDRFLSMGTLYQPEHAVRMRHSTLYFKQDGPKLTGYSITPKGNGLSGSSVWKDGRTEFRTVTFANGKLVFEFDVREVAHGWDRNIREKATIRVEAQLKGDRLVGKWGLFLKDGTEPFRGEWEAVRTKEPEKK